MVVARQNNIRYDYANVRRCLSYVCYRYVTTLYQNIRYHLYIKRKESCYGYQYLGCTEHNVEAPGEIFKDLIDHASLRNNLRLWERQYILQSTVKGWEISHMKQISFTKKLMSTPDVEQRSVLIVLISLKLIMLLLKEILNLSHEVHSILHIVGA